MGMPSVFARCDVGPEIEAAGREIEAASRKATREMRVLLQDVVRSGAAQTVR